MAWSTPKTDWKGTDYFTSTDWLRIVNNLKYIADSVGVAYTPYTSVVNGQTVLSSSDRNVVTDTIEKIYAKLNSSWNRGYVFSRKDYGSTWDSRDLNAIESLLLNLKEQIDGTIDNKVVYYAGDEIICGDVLSVGLL